MGWACTYCGDINSGALVRCEECGTDHAAEVKPRLEPQPVRTGELWLATLLGGALAGYAIAIWNGRLLQRHSLQTTILYALLGVGGWILTIIVLANLTPPFTDSSGSIEPGFGIPVALAIGFLLVSFPYNRETLAVNQWIWSHPGRKLVFNFGGSHPGLTYTSFEGIQGDLFGGTPEKPARFSIPVQPVAVIVVSAVIGVVTILLGNAFAPK